MSEYVETAMDKITTASREAVTEAVSNAISEVENTYLQQLASADGLIREGQLIIADLQTENALLHQRIAALARGFHRGYCDGLMSRRSTEAGSAGSRILSFVHDMNWKNWQPEAFGPLNTKLVEELRSLSQVAEARGQKIRLRLYSGVQSPPGLDDAPITWINLNEGLTGSAPRHWLDIPKLAWGDFLRRLAIHLADMPAVVEVVDPWGMIFYAEPMQRVFRSPENVAAALAGGWTEELDFENYEWSWEQHKQIFSPLGISTVFSFNTWTNIENRTIETVAPMLMATMVDILGEYAVLMNNSIADPINSLGASYQRLWLKLSEYAENGTRVSAQTRALKNMPEGSTPYATAAMCADLGFGSVEMPAGWLTLINETTARTLNEAFLANS